MPITSPPPSDQLLDAATRHVQSLSPPAGPHFFSDIAPADLELVAPHPVYTLTLSAFKAEGLAGSISAGWRFLMLAHGGVVGSAEIREDERQAVAVQADRFAATTAEAFNHLKSLPDVETGDYELRLLKLNSLYLWAIWLVGERQLIIPLDPAPGFVRAGQSYTEADLLNAVNQAGVEPFNPPDL